MSLDSIVNVTISTSAVSPSLPSFGVPLIANFHTRFGEIVRTYTSLAGMLADGFVVTDAAFVAASKLMAQQNTVQKFKVGRRTSASVHTLVLRPNPINLAVYGLTVNGIDCTFTADSTATAAEIIAGLVTAINAAVTSVTASSINSNADLQIVDNTSGLDMTVTLDSPSLWLRCTDNTTDAGIAADLAAINAADSDWYGLILTDGSKAEILAAAGFAESNKKILFAQTSDFGGSTATDCLDPAVTTDVLSALKTANRDRDNIMFSPHQGDFLHAGIAGEILPLTPGTWTEKFKSPAGVLSYTLTATAEGAVEAKNGNHFQVVSGTAIVAQGKTSKGSFLDFVMFLDLLKARVQAGIFGILVNSKKIPFDDNGIAAVVAAVRGAIADCVQEGSVDPASVSVRAPRVVDVNAGKRASRELPNVNASLRYTGAIHSVDVNLTVTT